MLKHSQPILRASQSGEARIAVEMVTFELLVGMEMRECLVLSLLNGAYVVSARFSCYCMMSLLSFHETLAHVGKAMRRETCMHACMHGCCVIVSHVCFFSVSHEPIELLNSSYFRWVLHKFISI
jgi:hypothetical protein